MLYCIVLDYWASKDSLAALEPQEIAAASDPEFEHFKDEEAQEYGSDLELLLDSVRDPIDRLYKLSIWIRNPSSRFTSSKALRHREPDPESGVDFLKAIEAFDHDYVSSVFLQYRKSLAIREFPTVEPTETQNGDQDESVWEPLGTLLSQHKANVLNDSESFLVRRIARANSRRRQQFAYWKKHRHKLIQHSESAMQHVKLGHDPIPVGTKLEVERLEPIVHPLGPTRSVTTATHLEISHLNIKDDQSHISVSEYAPSVSQFQVENVDFPPPPIVASGAKYFECPYCFTMCSTALLGPKAWKAHLIHDLRPYICTYEYCKTPDQLYDIRRDWIQHENTHRVMFRCPEHSHQVYDTLSGYEKHMQDHHDGYGDEISGNLLARTSQSVSQSPDRACPVCDASLSTSKTLQNHIALHLDRLALFSLPRDVSGEDNDSGGVASDEAHVAAEDSRIDDFSQNEYPLDEEDLSMADSRSDAGHRLRDTFEAKEKWQDIMSDVESQKKRLGIDVWDRHKQNIKKFYVDENQTLKQVMANMRNTHNFEASELAYKKNFRRWRMARDIPVSAMEQESSESGDDAPEADLETKEDLEIESQISNRHKRHSDNLAEADLKSKEDLEIEPKTSDRHGIRSDDLAEMECRQALKDNEATLGKYDLSTMRSQVALAEVLERRGNLPEASNLYKQAHKEFCHVYGLATPDTHECLRSLVRVLELQGEYGAAEAKIELAMAEWYRPYPGFVDTWDLDCDLGRILVKHSKHDEAKSLYRRLSSEYATKVDAESLERHRTALTSLGSILVKEGKYAEAEANLKTAFESAQKSLPRWNPRRFYFARKLITALREEHKYAEAEEWLRRELADYNISPEIHSREKIEALRELGKLCVCQSKNEDAKMTLQEALKEANAYLGSGQPLMLDLLYDLTDVLFMQGKFGDAEVTNREAIKRFGREINVDVWRVSRCMFSLARSLRLQSKNEEAEILFRQALRGLEPEINTEGSVTADCMNEVAWLLNSQNKTSEAMTMARKPIEGYRKSQGLRDPNTIRSTAGLVRMLKENKHWSEAAKLGELLLSMNEEELGQESLETLTLMHDLASTYCELGQWDEAERLEEQVVERSMVFLPARCSSTLESMIDLAYIYYNQGLWGESIYWGERVLDAMKPEQPDDDTKRTRIMGILAYSYRDKGDRHQAIRLMKWYIKRIGSVEGEDDKRVLEAKEALAVWQSEEI